jgi:hypothetical protein
LNFAPLENAAETLTQAAARYRKPRMPRAERCGEPPVIRLVNARSHAG